MSFAYECSNAALGNILAIIKTHVKTLNIRRVKYPVQSGRYVQSFIPKATSQTGMKSIKSTCDEQKKKKRRIEASTFSQNALRESKSCIYLIDTSHRCLAHMSSGLNKIRFPPPELLFEPDFSNKPPGTCTR